MGKKKVIDERMVREMKGRGADRIEVDADTILTPSARDAARHLGLGICEKAEAENPPSADQIDPDLIYRVLDGMIRRGWLQLPDGRGGAGSVRPPEQSEADGIVGLNEMQAMIGSLMQAMKGE